MLTPMPSTLVGLILAGLLAQSPDAGTPATQARADARAERGDLAGAVADYAALLRDPRADRPRTLYRLAAVEHRSGRHDEAAAHAREAAGLLTADGRTADAADAWNLAAMAEFTRGNYGASADHLTTAIRLSGDAADWGRHAEQLSNLGSVHFLTGRYDDAASTFDRALALSRADPAAAWAPGRRAVVIANQAALAQRLGRYAEALSLYRSLMAGGAVFPPGQRGQVLVNQGALYRRLGDPYKALDAYASARAQFTAAHDAGSEAAVLTNRGIALALDLVRLSDAATAFGEALSVATTAGNRREALLARLYRGEVLLRDGRVADARVDFLAASAAAAALDAREETWKALYGLARVDLASGRTGEAMATLDRAIAIVEQLRERLAVPSTRAEFFQDKRELYDARIAAGLHTDTPTATFALIEGSRARAWRDRMALDAVSLDAVQAALPVDTVLFAYWTSAIGHAVVRVTRHDAQVLPLTLDLADVRALDAALRRPDDAWTVPAGTLGRALIPPGALRGAAHLIVVPDGALGAVPFDALTVAGAMLGDSVAVSVLPTAALLVASSPAATGPPRWRAPWSPQLAAFGDPLPAADPWASAASQERLAASASEVEAVSSELGGSHRLFLGADNQKRALVEVLATPPAVLHLATHGVADQVAGEASRLLFSPPSPGAPPAALFLREIYSLTLTGVDLVVLSACETERGPEVRGEGVQGFSRGLLAAGARRAVTTLWRVPDRSTAMLMRHFYRAVQRGRPLDIALADAKRALRADDALAHPHYWAAFVLTGPAGAVPAALRWRDVVGSLLVAAGLVATALVVRSNRRTARPTPSPDISPLPHP
jgi:tetratricopeptide (TPR) repeat protein